MTPRETITATTVTTWEGKELDLLDPKGWRINIRDIARSLACTNRFNGHSALPYSVAQHSCVVVKIIQQKTTDPLVALNALLHDAHEAYTGDISKPLQEALGKTNLTHIQNQLDVAILQSLGVSPTIEGKHFALIYDADQMALASEWRDLMATPPPSRLATPANFTIKPHATWHKAEDEFLKTYQKLAMAAGTHPI